MDCWVCERTALGACRFCGRGTCREHAKTQPFVFDVFRGNKHQMLRALVVEDALHCGVCRPRGDPVDLPEGRVVRVDEASGPHGQSAGNTKT